MKKGLSGLSSLQRFSEILREIASYSVLGLIAFLTVNVILRYFFRKPLVFTEEVTGYFLSFMVFAGLGHTLRTGGHVVTDVLARKFSERTRTILQWPILIGGILFAIFFAVAAWMLMIKNYVRESVDFGSLGTPEWVPNIIFVVGSTIFLLEMLSLLSRSGRK